MIIDQISHASLYFSLNPRLATALSYLKETDFSRPQPEKYEIDGKNIFALYQQTQTRSRAEGFWEAHRKYIDIHYVIKGAEKIGYANIEFLTPEPYDEEKDFQIYKGEGDFVIAYPGMFVVMMPQDAHMPLLSVHDLSATPLTKVVIKVLSY